MPALKNPRHERLVQALAKGRTAKDAYKAAGFKPDDGNASRLINSAKITGRLQELTKKSAEEAAVTAASILRDLGEVQKRAMKRGQNSAAVQALMGKAKLMGLIIDRREVGPVGAFEAMTDKQLVDEAARRARELGVAGPHLLIEAATDEDEEAA